MFDADLLDDTILDRLIRRYREQLQNVKRLNKGLNEEDVEGKSYQALRFMVGPGHCPMISKYGPSLSKAVGPVDPSFLVVKKSHLNKENIHLTAS